MLALFLLAACSRSDPAAPGAQAVTLTTRDDVTLKGDLYPGTSGAPGVLLLHMAPAGGNDRNNWPASFIEALGGQGWTVLAIDRRGAGASEGVTAEAVEGEKGRYDVEASVKLLQDEGAGAIAILGASNGTTSMLDYVTWAPGEGLTQATATGFLTGGSYTETNTAMGQMPPLPAIFTYSTAEREWSVEQQTLDPGGWVFQEYVDGDHGTKMFDAAPQVSNDLVSFLSGAL